MYKCITPEETQRVETRVVIKCKTITLSHSGVFTFLYLFSLRWIHYYFGCINVFYLSFIKRYESSAETYVLAQNVH